METVDMSRYVMTGAGSNGESYDSLDNPDMMIKLYNATYPTQPVIDELEIAKKVYSIGVPSPEPGELVESDGRLGIRFCKVAGKRSFSRAVADEPERVEEYAREFARHGKMLHSTPCPDGMFESVKDQYLKLLDADKTFTPAEREVMRRFIKHMPDCNTAVHGDFHMGNLLTTLPKGAPMSDPHDILFIDLGYFAYGCPLLDIGMLDCICNYSEEQFVQHDMHISSELARKFWHYFVDEYFFGPEKLGEKWFGPQAKQSEISPMMAPYTSIKLLLVAFNLGFMPENYIPLVRKAIPMMESYMD